MARLIRTQTRRGRQRNYAILRQRGYSSPQAFAKAASKRRATRRKRGR